jgi:FkbM family methyltransferase
LCINRAPNVGVFEVAVTERGGVARLEEGYSNSTARLAAHGSIEVKTVSLDELLFAAQVPAPQFMKVDVEGAELDVLKGAKSLLSSHHPTIFLATHGRQIHLACCALLVALGYELRAIGQKSLPEADEVLGIWRR